MRWLKKHISTIIILIILLAGLGVLFYPTVSDWWNTMHQTKVISEYQEVISGMTDEEYDELFEVAEAYNEHLKSLTNPFEDYDEISDEYYSALDVAGNGSIGYVTIDKIQVSLPIYHGTSDDVLNIAVGHLEGSTLPIGGESTHAVLSAHRGLPSAKLFSDLDKLEVGDTFSVTVLNRAMIYEVDQILIVEPTQMEALNVVEGEDYCTLLTCTPYGINTHRLLVRGHRTGEVEAAVINVYSDAQRIDTAIVIPAVALPLLLILLIGMLIKYRRAGKHAKAKAAVDSMVTGEAPKTKKEQRAAAKAAEKAAKAAEKAAKAEKKASKAAKKAEKAAKKAAKAESKAADD